MYGLIKKEHLEDMAFAVCECLGHGINRKATDMLIETANAETGGGTIKDITIGAGMGLTQFDKIPFYDVKDRCRDSDKKKILDSFDIDIDLVEWEHLRYNPLLALIFTRLKYKKITESIPNSVTLRAIYWKRYYNTYAKNAKGTPEHYLQMNKGRL